VGDFELVTFADSKEKGKHEKCTMAPYTDLQRLDRFVLKEIQVIGVLLSLMFISTGNCN